MRIALISCSKSKRSYACMAKELYSASELFSVSYKYVKALKVDKIYILSAKHGLIHEDKIIAPYELSMKDLPDNRRIDWANYVKKQIDNELNPTDDEFIILTGMDYLTPLIKVKAFDKFSFPLRGMNFGTRIAYMNNEIERLNSPTPCTSEQCLILHKLFNESQYYNFTEINNISFNNGIYIVFEKGETYNGYNRIVRVGTHRSPNRLKARLRDHYLSQNKDGSIFRKNIGKAILNKHKDKYLDIWKLNTSKQENMQFVDHKIQRVIEDEVSEVLQQNTFFTVFEVVDVGERLRLESSIIATLNKCEDFKQSLSWLGNYSTENEIRNSGMWLKEGLNDIPLTYQELSIIANILNTVHVPYHHTPQNAQEVLVENTNIPHPPTTTIADVVNFIKNILLSEREKGKSDCILISGEIAKQMGVSQRMPTICNAMRKIMGFRDEVIYQPPKGNGTTLKIRYFL